MWGAAKCAAPPAALPGLRGSELAGMILHGARALWVSLIKRCDKMVCRSIVWAVIAVGLSWSVGVVAQHRVHTETIRPPPTQANPPGSQPATPPNDVSTTASPPKPSTPSPQASIG